MTDDRSAFGALGARRAAGARSARVSRPASWVAGVLAGSGVLSLLLYSVRCEQPLSVLGSGLLITGAVAVGGAALGFLFGVPHTLAAQSDPDGAEVRPRPAYVANTNLEQVSDWLTKLLIGAGLTQLGALSGWFRRLCRTLAPAFGDRPDSAVFAGALVAEFFVLGFLGGWLSTRLLLASALSEADRRALDSFIEAESFSEQGAQDEADSLRARAMEELGLPHSEARRYDDLRRILPRGSGRTEQMTSLVAAARDSARESGLDTDHVRELFGQGGDGQRIYALALMQGAPEIADLDLVLEGVEHSRSAFEQYQALVAAENLVPLLSSADRARLERSLRVQTAPGSYIARSTDRRRIAERVLSTLPGPS
ncbi:hypothetical protein ACIRJO_30115 [Streptomyces sp. NPDC102394]|uniref:hypothetical protein n=1 Tax=Streptomyces sp. NPDC102394 TaxID=3366167 RepID=UPI003802F7B4